MTEFITRANYEDKKFEIIIKTDSEAHYKLAETFSRALIDDCNYEKVVRCKDCSHYTKPYCTRFITAMIPVNENDYCSYAERKEAEE